MSLKNIIYNFSFYILAFGLISGCQSSGGVARSDKKVPDASLDKAIKVCFLSPARDARTGDTFVLYQVLLSRSWCQLKGREIKDEFASVLAPAVAFDVDDALMSEFREFMVQRNFLNLPDHRINIQAVQNAAAFPTILSLETSTAKKTVVVSELSLNQQGGKAISEIEQYFFAVTDKFPPTKVTVNILK